MKQNKFKKIIPLLIFSLIVPFVFFIYEPIVMYSGNIDEFWFDIQNLISITIIPFLVLSLIFIVLSGLCYFIKKEKIFYTIQIIAYSVFVYLYIHGNFLTNALPTLNGETIIWSDYGIWHIVSIAILLIMAILLFIGIKKKGLQKTSNYSFIAVCFCSIMMLVSFCTILTTEGLFKDKNMQVTANTKNINKISTTENFYILLLDCTDSVTFNKKIEANYSDNFKDFTYFSDTAPGYSLTRDSIPLIFSGIYNHNETAFNTYSNNSFNASKIFNQLEQKEYNMNFYEDDFIWSSDKALKFANLSNDIKEWNKVTFLKQEIKYVLYKYLPFPLKPFSHIENMDFNSALVAELDQQIFEWSNLTYYNNVIKALPEKTDEKLFQFVHIEGSHAPYDMDEDLETIDVSFGTYDQKVGASAKIASAAIQRLKESGNYDNSVIVILADHGWYSRDAVLYIKGFNETNDAMITSDKQISLSDMDEIFVKLADGQTAAEASSNIPVEGRQRYYYVNPYYDKEPMTEWVVNGRSYNENDWQKTGIEYAYPF